MEQLPGCEPGENSGALRPPEISLPSSLQHFTSALSLWSVHRSCVIVFPSQGAPSAREGLWGFCLDFP